MSKSHFPGALRETLAEEMNRFGLPLGARGVLVGGTSAIEEAALEAMKEAQTRREREVRPSPLSLFVGRLEARGLQGAADQASGPDPSPFARAACAAIGRVAAGALAPARSSATPAPMSSRRRSNDRTATVDARTSILDIEEQIGRVETYVGDRPYALRMTPDERSGLLKEIWLSMLVASAVRNRAPLTLAATGVSSWPHFEDADWEDDDSAALSMPVLQALQCGIAVTPSRSEDEPLRADPVRRYAARRRGGLLGRGGRVIRLVEFDPQEPVALRLGRGSERTGRLEGIVLEAMTAFEVGARARGATPTGAGPRQSIVSFLAELHANAHAYASSSTGVRVVRMGKHLLDLESGRKRAGDFPNLAGFVSALGIGSINLIEASVSDFGPGLLDGFLASDPGKAFDDLPRREVLLRLVHEQLSSNGGDPNAGLGTIRAIEAARSIGGFVSLRTGEHWLVTSLDRQVAELIPVEGRHPRVVGTHWTLLYPDPLP